MRRSAGPPAQGLPAASSVLAVCAHPDDESFGMGAVLEGYASSGATVSVLCFTRGEASSLGAAEDLAECRRLELHAAADALGLGRVELHDHPDGLLAAVPVEKLADEVATMAAEVGADLFLVFDEGGVTGHPDHRQATAAALAVVPPLPVLAWTLPLEVAGELNAELGTTLVGRPDEEIDAVVQVDRAAQQRAIACHLSQSSGNPVLWRRLELLEDRESLRWLRRVAPHPKDHAPAPAPDQLASLAEEWDRRYATTTRLFRAEPDETLVELVEPLSCGRALDLGAGEGRNSLWLAGHGWQVVAVDVSKAALGRLEDAASSDGTQVLTLTGDMTAFLAGAQARGEVFDLVVLAYIHPEPAERSALLRAVASVVAPGGFLFVVAHHLLPDTVPGHFDPSRLYGTDDLREAVTGFEVVQLGERQGSSDVAAHGTDVIVWARRPETTLTPAS